MRSSWWLMKKTDGTLTPSHLTSHAEAKPQLPSGDAIFTSQKLQSHPERTKLPGTDCWILFLLITFRWNVQYVQEHGCVGIPMPPFLSQVGCAKLKKTKMSLTMLNNRRRDNTL